MRLGVVFGALAFGIAFSLWLTDSKRLQGVLLLVLLVMAYAFITALIKKSK